MQTTIYYKDEDEYLIDKVEEKANRERKSKSAVILSILEEYFEAESRIGEILTDMGAVSSDKVKEALEVQEQEKDKKLGEILVENDHVREVDLDRALQVQER
ncbi:MAG: hypothetical protein V5A87_05240 [Candidatus Bipolaricaulota bacterium]|nr:hypothetical protein [Candidatus Bipolaricaulota bacterium]MBS3792506.1 hypothetical protein [Candidatus Bipolaricaulota bacterium]